MLAEEAATAKKASDRAAQAAVRGAALPVPPRVRPRLLHCRCD